MTASSVARTLYRAILRTGRSTSAPLRIRLPVTKSQSQWLLGSQQYGFVPHRSAVKEVFPSVSASSEADTPELSEREFRDLVRAEFRRALEANDSKALDMGLNALRELHGQLEMARRSSSTLSEHAPTGAAVLVEATSTLVGHERSHWVFQYRIRIANVGATPVQLIGRQWTIRNADGTVNASVPRGSPGVVGQTPRLQPGGDAFEYASGASFVTPGGSVEGSFQMVSLLPGGQQESFDAHVGRFECLVDEGV